MQWTKGRKINLSLWYISEVMFQGENYYFFFFIFFFLCATKITIKSDNADRYLAWGFYNFEVIVGKDIVQSLNFTTLNGFVIFPIPKQKSNSVPPGINTISHLQIS